jgi:hypothetical protein
MHEWNAISNAFLQAAHELDDTRTQRNIERARADKAEAELANLRTLIDCVVAYCEASASSHQERIETIHRITSAYALMWESPTHPKEKDHE